MVLEGTVQNGVIVFASPKPLPEGTKVKVVIDEPPGDQATLVDLLRHAGALSDMPGDFARQHDHYIHGTPRQ